MELWIGVGVVVLLVLYLIATYNGLVVRRHRVANAWAQIDVQLKRRHDLVPNLVSTVRGIMQHERDVLERVVRARQQALDAGGDVPARAEAENRLGRSLRSVFAIAEAYPELRANQNMALLQEELSSTENRIAFARQHYNDAVTEFNTARDTFPRSLVAGLLGFAPAAPFALDDDAARVAPRVEFA